MALIRSDFRVKCYLGEKIANCIKVLPMWNAMNSGHFSLQIDDEHEVSIVCFAHLLFAVKQIAMRCISMNYYRHCGLFFSLEVGTNIVQWKLPLKFASSTNEQQQQKKCEFYV